MPILTDSIAALQQQVAVLTARNQSLSDQADELMEQGRFRLSEIEHRLMNTFTTVQVLIVQTARTGDSGEEFRAKLVARLLSLARSHELLGAGYPDGAPLSEVVERCLQPYAGPSGRTSVVGEIVHLPAQHVPVLGLVFHELATNAAKYGALSIAGGTLNVCWQVEAASDARGRSVAIVWTERDGPPVSAPQRRGFGSRLLERGLSWGADGMVERDFAPHGLTCRIRIPLAAMDT